jgi:hypothetical protein
MMVELAAAIFVGLFFAFGIIGLLEMVIALCRFVGEDARECRRQRDLIRACSVAKNKSS